MTGLVVFQGGRIECVTNLVGVPSMVTTAGTYDTTYSDAALQVTPTQNFDTPFRDMSFNAVSIPAGNICYTHYTAITTGGGSSGGRFAYQTWKDSSGFPWVRLLGPDISNNFQLQYNSGTGASPVWTNLGAATTSLVALNKWDISIYIDPAGTAHSVALYYNSSQQSGVGGTFSQASFTNLANCTWGGGYGSGLTANYSQIIITQNISTIGAILATSRATGAGHYAQWTGAYTDVNEPVNNDSTVNQSSTVGNNQSYAMGDVTVPTGYFISEIWYWLRGNEAGGSPANIKPLLRTGTSDYVGGNMSNIGVGFNALGARYAQDPNTSAAWTASGWNAYEAGYQAAA